MGGPRLRWVELTAVDLWRNVVQRHCKQHENLAYLPPLNLESQEHHEMMNEAAAQLHDEYGWFEYPDEIELQIRR